MRTKPAPLAHALVHIGASHASLTDVEAEAEVKPQLWAHHCKPPGLSCQWMGLLENGGTMPSRVETILLLWLIHGPGHPQGTGDPGYCSKLRDGAHTVPQSSSPLPGTHPA